LLIQFVSLALHVSSHLSSLSSLAQIDCEKSILYWNPTVDLALVASALLTLKCGAIEVFTACSSQFCHSHKTHVTASCDKHSVLSRYCIDARISIILLPISEY
jgi:hypothetical protein